MYTKGHCTRSGLLPWNLGSGFISLATTLYMLCFLSCSALNLNFSVIVSVRHTFVMYVYYIEWIRYGWKWRIRCMNEWLQYHMTCERVRESKKWTNHILLKWVNISDMTLPSITYCIYQVEHWNKQQLQRGYKNYIEEFRCHPYNSLSHKVNILETIYIIANIFQQTLI